MPFAQDVHQRWCSVIRCMTVAALMAGFAPACGAQAKPPAPQNQQPVAADPGQLARFAEQFGRLFERLQQNVKFPSARTQSRLLPLLPQNTIFYAAFPNYGDAAQQALKAFRQELQENAALREWWEKGQVAATGPKVEDFVEEFYQLSQFLGDEVVISGVNQGNKPGLLLVAEVRKPGLKMFLQQAAKELAGKSKQAVRVMDAQELAAATDQGLGDEPVVLVRPDLVMAAPDIATLRVFNARVDEATREFASTPFGQRLTHSYDGGATLVVGADLHSILSQIPPGAATTLQRTGFADAQYLVWEHKTVAGQDISQLELTFTGSRRGIAAWLAAPTPMGSLDFVSPKPTMMVSLALTDLGNIFDGIEELAAASNPNAFASVRQMEQALQISLKDDVLKQLQGELTLEIVTRPPTPGWKAILRVVDPVRLQQTLNTLLAATHLGGEQFDQAGVTHHAVRIPSANATAEFDYAFVDGYLVVGSSRETVAEAARLHRGGGSLGKSSEFAASLPPGHPNGFSAIWYQDPMALAALRLRQVAPEMAAAIAQSGAESKPAVMCLYGDQTAIREASTSQAGDVGAMLVVAAIAIPNLLRSRMAANEASAVGSLRSINTAQVYYSNTYPRRGYAPDLATLGPGPREGMPASQRYAGVLDSTLAGASCTGGASCTKSGFRFSVTGVCKLQRCREFVAVATPVSSSTGAKNFCTTSDGVIRFKPGASLETAITVRECRQWAPIQ